MEAAKAKGLSIGIVVTSSVTHATPACFVAHVASRGEEPAIAEQIIQLRPNIVFGGGKSFFMPSTATGSARKDNRNLLDEARASGYEFIENGDQLRKAQSDYILGLFAPNHLTTIAPEPSLAEMTEKAVQILSRNKKGFFLMVEGSQIDFASHGNDTTGTIRQALLFDQAIRKAEDFAQANKKTLVVTTADHETGGLAILNCALEAPRKVTTAWGTTGHSAIQVPMLRIWPRIDSFHRGP